MNYCNVYTRTFVIHEAGCLKQKRFQDSLNSKKTIENRFEIYISLQILKFISKSVFSSMFCSTELLATEFFTLVKIAKLLFFIILVQKKFSTSSRFIYRLICLFIGRGAYNTHANYCIEIVWLFSYNIEFFCTIHLVNNYYKLLPRKKECLRQNELEMESNFIILCEMLLFFIFFNLQFKISTESHYYIVLYVSIE